VRQRLFSDAEVDPLLALPPSATSIRYTEQTTKSLGYIVSFGFDFLIAKGASIQMTGNYTTLSAKVPSVPWSLRSKSSVRLDSLSAELSLAWHF
jgi:outer membrane protein W